MPNIIKTIGLRANGEIEYLKQTDYEFCREWIGGYIEVLSCERGGYKYVLLVDDEGAIKNPPLPINQNASMFYGQTIRGDAILSTDKLLNWK